MTTFAFSATVAGLDLDDLNILDALFTDEFVLVPSEVDGVVSLDVEIDAPSGESALQKLVHHLKSIQGVHLVRIDLDLVNVSEIATRLELSREAVRLLSVGARGGGDFPQHRHIVGTQKVWAWADVHAWALVHGRLPEGEPAPLDAACVDWFNGQLVPATKPQILLHFTGIPRSQGLRSVRGDSWTRGSGARMRLPLRHRTFTARTGERWTMAGGLLERDPAA